MTHAEAWLAHYRSAKALREALTERPLEGVKVDEDAKSCRVWARFEDHSLLKLEGETVTASTVIKELTPAHRRLVQQRRSRWLALGRSTEPLDREEARDAFARVYKSLGRAAPEVLFLESPLACLEVPVRDRSTGRGPSVHTQLSELFTGDSGCAPDLEARLWDSLVRELLEPLAALYDMMENVRDEIRARTAESGGGGGARLAAGSQVEAAVAQMCSGTWRCAWDVLDETCVEIGASPSLPEWAVWLNCSRHAHVWVPSEHTVLASERPVLLTLDGDGRLHNEKGPALVYRDGFAVYALNGVRVPARVATHPASITLEEIRRATAGSPYQRVLISRYGVARYARDMGLRAGKAGKSP